MSLYSPIGKTLFLAFMFSLAVYPGIAPQATDSRGPLSTISDSIPLPDFEVATSLPNIVPADGTTLATSTILVRPNNGFTDTVILSDPSVPATLTCTAVVPDTIPNGSGRAAVSCSSILAGSYNVTIVGTSNTITHNATATFRYGTSVLPGFTISAITPLSFATISTATSSVTVSSLGGFDQKINLTSTVNPNVGLSVSLNPQSFILGSGTSIATFSSATPGDYTVTFTATSGSLLRTTTIIVAVTLAVLPDFAISASSNSLNFTAGNSGTTRITITPYNGFTGSIALAISAPAGVSCDLSTTSIQSSGESTLTCKCYIPGDYRVLIRASNGDDTHMTTVNEHVKTQSAVAPTPSTFPKPPIGTFHIVAVLVVIVVASATIILLRRKSKRSEVPNSQP